MNTVLPGGHITLSSTFLDSPGGTPVDPTSVALSIEKDGTVLAGPFTPSRLDTGYYSYNWLVPENASPGQYVARWTVTIEGETTTGYDVFDVLAPGVVGVSVDDVSNWTGVTVTDAEIAQATSIIELYAGVAITNYQSFNARDRSWIAKAVGYQAAWLSSQPGYFGRTDFLRIQQDGFLTITRDEKTLALAPLARKALARVSWVRPRTVRVSQGPQSRAADRLTAGLGHRPGLVYPVGAPVTDAMVDSGGW